MKEQTKTQKSKYWKEIGKLPVKYNNLSMTVSMIKNLKQNDKAVENENHYKT